MITFAVQFFVKVAKSKREFVIPFIGLNVGNHTFEFDISDSFFEDFEYSIIHSGNVHVNLIFEKKETMMIGAFSCEGEVSAFCDRCNDPLRVFVKDSFQLVFKLGTEVIDDEALIVLPPESYELDVAPFVYELITVSLPARMIHDEGKCNEEMVEVLSRYLLNPDDEDDLDDDYGDEDWEEDDEEGPDGDIDPRWSMLKNLN